MMAIIRENLWAIISVGMTALLAFVVGSTKVQTSLTSLSDRVLALEKRADGAEAYHRCSTRHFDRLESGANGEPPCVLEGQ